MSSTSLLHLSQQERVSGLGSEGREQKDETEHFRQYHDEGRCPWWKKISNFQLFCSSIWFILGSVTGLIFISFIAGKGSCVEPSQRSARAEVK